MVLVAHRKVVAPGIEAVTELGAGRQILELSGVGPEPDHAAGRLERRRIRAIGKADAASAVAELVWKDNRGRRTFVGQVDPVVQTVNRAVNRVLRIGKGETREYHSPDLGRAVAVRIFEVENVRRIGDQHALFPSHHASGHGQLVGEDGSPVGPAVPVRIFEQDDAADLAFDVQRITRVLNNVDPSVFVELHRDRTADVRLGDIRFDAKTGLDFERLQSLFGTVRRTSVCAASEREEHGEQGQAAHHGACPLRSMAR